MTTRVFLVRHGATELSAEDRYAGSIEVALSDEGRAQADALGCRLTDQKFDAIYASPQGRAVETARIVAKPHKLDVTTVPELREISHGRWEGLNRSEVEEKYPDEYRLWEENPYAFAPAEGESGLNVVHRALPSFLHLVKKHSGKSILVVSHKATIRLLICSFLGFDPRRFRDFLDQNPAALNILDFKDESHARLTTFNDTAHYTAPGSYVPAAPTHRLSKWWDIK